MFRLPWCATPDHTPPSSPSARLFLLWPSAPSLSPFGRPPSPSSSSSSTMIQFGTRMLVSDNSGAQIVQCIKVLGGLRRRTASLGDVVTVCVKELGAIQLHTHNGPACALRHGLAGLGSALMLLLRPVHAFFAALVMRRLRLAAASIASAGGAVSSLISPRAGPRVVSLFPYQTAPARCLRRASTARS